MKPMTKFERTCRECFQAATTKADIAPLLSILEGYLRASAAKRKTELTPVPAPQEPKRPVGRPRIHDPALPRPVGRPRLLVPHYTLLEAYIMESSLGGTPTEIAFIDEPLTVASLPDLAAPLSAWCLRQLPYAESPEEGLAQSLARFEFELPRNGRPGKLVVAVGAATLTARIVRSSAAVQEPFGEYSPFPDSDVA